VSLLARSLRMIEPVGAEVSRASAWRSPRAEQRVWSKRVVWITCLALALPVLVDLAQDPKHRPFGYAAGDTFYYLGVARIAVEHGSLSLDGVNATNGFHPLWQLLSVLVYGACRLVGRVDAALLVIVLASLVCAAAAVWLLGDGFRRATGTVPAAFVTLPIGVYALLASYYWHVGPPEANGGLEGPLPVYGTLYSFVNGMESGLALLGFALLCATQIRCAGKSSARAGLWCGGACALLCLARLDHAAFVVVPLSLWAAELFQTRRRHRFLLAALGAAVLPVMLYLAINVAYAGVALPVSGAEKSRFPMPYLEQVGYALDLLRAPLEPMDPLIIYRILPMTLCSLWALGYVAILTKLQVGARGVTWALRDFATTMDLFLVKMAPGVVLLGLYDLLYVHGVGHWYFPVSTLYVSLTSLSLLQALTRRVRFTVPRKLGAACALAIGVVALFVRFHHKPDYHRKFADFYWETAPRVRQALGDKLPKLIEVDDGIIAYSLRVPSMSGIGYVLDAEAQRAKRAGRLVDVAYHRGFRGVTTFYYARHGGLASGGAGAAYDWAAALLGEDLTGYRVAVLYDDATFTIVELSRQEG